MVRRLGIKLALTGLLLSAVWTGFPLQARDLVADSHLATVAIAELPRQAVETYHLIQQGGPFPYAKDGTVFANRERLLPGRKRGHYREYTVRTPGVRHRGPRRIVCGGPIREPEACYYTSDHYGSFRRIVQ